MNMLLNFLRPQWADEAEGNRLAATNTFRVDLPLALEDVLSDSLSDFTLSPADRTKKRATSARDELAAENEELFGENLSDEADIMKAEAIITAKLDAIKKRNAAIAGNKQLIAILDRTKADIDKLSEPAPASSPKTDKRKKAREVAA